MIVKNINVSQSMETMNQVTGLKKWDKLGMDAELQEGDNAEECIMELKKRIQVLFGITNGQAVSQTWGHDPMTIPVVSTQVIYDLKREKSEIAIENAASISDLEFYVEAAEKYGLMGLYNQKLKTLK